MLLSIDSNQFLHKKNASRKIFLRRILTIPRYHSNWLMPTLFTYYHMCHICNRYGSRQRLLNNSGLPSKAHSFIHSILHSHQQQLSVISYKNYSSFSTVFSYSLLISYSRLYILSTTTVTFLYIIYL